VAHLRPSALLILLCAFFAVCAIHTAELRAAAASREASVAGCTPLAPPSRDVVAKLADHRKELEAAGADCPTAVTTP
jgi:hypothetical protein